jgi:hypothetical protein
MPPHRNKRFYSSPKDVQIGSEAHPAYCLIVISDFPGVKSPVFEADHSHPFRVEVKSWYNCISAPPL